MQGLEAREKALTDQVKNNGIHQMDLEARETALTNQEKDYGILPTDLEAREKALTDQEQANGIHQMKEVRSFQFLKINNFLLKSNIFVFHLRLNIN